MIKYFSLCDKITGLIDLLKQRSAFSTVFLQHLSAVSGFDSEINEV